MYYDVRSAVVVGRVPLVRHIHGTETRIMAAITAIVTQNLLDQTVAGIITQLPRNLVQLLDIHQLHEVLARKKMFLITRQGGGAALLITTVHITLLPDTRPTTVDTTARVATTIPPASLDHMPHQAPVIMVWDIICQPLI